MSSKIILQYALIITCLLCVANLAVLGRKKAFHAYRAFAALLLVRGVTALVSEAIMYHRRSLGIGALKAYSIYFYSYWTSAAIQVVLQLLVIYSIYRLLMRPLEGLQEMGKIIFRWITAVSMLLSLMLALGPHAQGPFYLATLLGQVQEGESVLIVCLLVFVSFATRPLGLSLRSRPFGILLGLGVSATAGLVMASWLNTTSAQSLYSPVFAWGASVSVLTLCVWNVYFVLPEPQRKLILLPTTSPYLHWNQISAALGDDPGLVAIGGASPAMFASAELEAFFAFAASERSDALLGAGADLEALAAHAS